jgi:hypothetical protein
LLLLLLLLPSAAVMSLAVRRLSLAVAADVVAGSNQLTRCGGSDRGGDGDGGEEPDG